MFFAVQLPVAPFHYAIDGAVLVGVRRDSCTCEVGMAHEGYMAPRNAGRAEGFLRVFLVDILKQPLRLIHGSENGLEKTNDRASANINKI